MKGGAQVCGFSSSEGSRAEKNAWWENTVPTLVVDSEECQVARRALLDEVDDTVAEMDALSSITYPNSRRYEVPSMLVCLFWSLSSLRRAASRKFPLR